ncbi:peptidase M16 inactive domain protein [Streptococcus sanguinis SK49]|nr:peptidase M16 inactive domain protein [Streptococcus sanguinis SK49]
MRGVMEITKGVRLHFIQSEKFKTNKIRVRFSAPMSKETVAGRVLTASMLETVNAVYPTSQAFRERLANLYGADYSTSLSRRGLVHYLDINLSFVRDKFLSRKNVLTDAMLDFLKASLFSPLVSQDAFDESAFEIEKKNILNDLEAEIENHFYHAHRELDKLFYEEEEMQMPRVGTIELIQ